MGPTVDGSGLGCIAAALPRSPCLFSFLPTCRAQSFTQPLLDVSVRIPFRNLEQLPALSPWSGMRTSGISLGFEEMAGAVLKGKGPGGAGERETQELRSGTGNFPYSAVFSEQLS